MYYEEIFFNLREIVGKDERVLWYGKPDKKCFILESIFNILLPFALLWGTIATLFLYQIFSHPEKVHNNPGPVLTIIFFAIWLSPVWIYLYVCFTSPFEYKNVGYIITDKALYRSKGLILEKIEKVEYSKIKSVKINIGFLDKLLGVGCVNITTHFYKVEYVNFQETISDFSIRNIKGAEVVYQIIKNAMTEFEFNYQKKEVEKVNKIDLQSEYFKSLDKEYIEEDKEKYQEEFFRKMEKAADFQEDFYNKLDK